ncbi:MAG: M16 family metallopeptidase [Candidatus Binatia bacterium]
MTCTRLIIIGLSLTLWLGWAAPLHAFHTWKKKILPNGMTLLVVEKTDVPAVSVTLLVKHGTTSEPIDKQGVASLTAHLLTEGTRQWSSDQIAKRIAALGGEVVTDVGFDSTTIDWAILKQDLESALAILAEAVRNPVFPQTAVERERTVRLAELKQKREDAPQTSLFRALFGDGPYGGSVSEATESLTTITQKDVAQFHRRTYRPGDTILAAAGDVTFAEFDTLATQYFGDWSATEAGENAPATFANTATTVILVDRLLTQASLRLAFVGASATDPNTPALKLLTHVLADGPESRLGQTLREQRGWTYTVRGTLETFRKTGVFFLTMSVPYEYVLPALEQSARELVCLAATLVTEAELTRAKQQAATEFYFATENLPDLSRFIARYEALHAGQEPPERLLSVLDRVTPTELQQAARQYLNPWRAVVSIVGDRERLKKFAPRLVEGNTPQWATQCGKEGQ